MTLLTDIHDIAFSYSRKGGKGYRRLQIRRLTLFAHFAASRGIFEIGQVGERTFRDFFASHPLSEKTQIAYRQAFECLKREKKRSV